MKNKSDLEHAQLTKRTKKVGRERGRERRKRYLAKYDCVGQNLTHAIVFCQISFPPLPYPPPSHLFCPRTAKTRSGDEISYFFKPRVSFNFFVSIINCEEKHHFAKLYVIYILPNVTMLSAVLYQSKNIHPSKPINEDFVGPTEAQNQSSD